MKRLLWIPLGLLAACATAGPTRPITAQAVPDASGVQRLAVDMHSDYFAPDRIIVHVGEPVELTLHNRATFTHHNFTVKDPSMDIKVDARARHTEVVTFTPRHLGAVPFHCDVDGHAHKGMTGTLVVVP